MITNFENVLKCVLMFLFICIYFELINYLIKNVKMQKQKYILLFILSFF